MSWVRIPPEAARFFLGKVTALGVLCCFALFFHLACFFLPSFSSLINMYILSVCIYMYHCFMFNYCCSFVWAWSEQYNKYMECHMYPIRGQLHVHVASNVGNYSISVGLTCMYIVHVQYTCTVCVYRGVSCIFNMYMYNNYVCI